MLLFMTSIVYVPVILLEYGVHACAFISYDSLHALVPLRYRLHSLPPLGYRLHSLPPLGYRLHSLPPFGYRLHSLPPLG